jgi:hypothetical protein
MSQKKKLVLSPLPEQTDDYSRYEESVTRWDRIIAVGVLFVLVLVGLVYALSGNNSEDIGSVVQNPVPALEQVPALSLDENATAKDQTDPKAVDEIVQPEVQSVLMPEQNLRETNAISEEVPARELKTNIAASLENQTANTALKDEPVEIVKNIVHDEVNVVAKTQRQVVSIVNKSIAKAVLTLELSEKESVVSIPYELVLPEEGIVKVMLLTEMNGLRGKRLFHDWYRNGIRQARVKIPVNLNKQLSHSSKYINTQMIGDWQVKVVDEKAQTYVLADFKVVLP